MIGRRQELIGSAARSLSQKHIDPIEYYVGENGKPHAILAGNQNIFYSFSHARRIDQPFAVAAVSLDMDIGIDVEPWPIGNADPDFLKVIATKEDEGALRILNLSKRDSGIALWVIKEAALKCTGEVMIKPNYLSVTYEDRNSFRVRSSTEAGAPHPDICVRLFVLNASHMPQKDFIAAIAMSASCDVEVRIDASQISADQRWQFEDFAIPLAT